MVLKTLGDIPLDTPVEKVMTPDPVTATAKTTVGEAVELMHSKGFRNLPILGRDPLSVLQTQPGVAYNGNSATVINGLRTSYSDITLDGVNIQDNYIRDNALDYVPNRLLLGQVRQMTLVSSMDLLVSSKPLSIAVARSLLSRRSRIEPAFCGD